MMTRRRPLDQKANLRAIAEVMEGAGGHQDGMIPPGTRTAAIPAWRPGGDRAPVHSLALLSIMELEPVQYLTLAGAASSHSKKLKNKGTGHHTTCWRCLADSWPPFRVPSLPLPFSSGCTWEDEGRQMKVLQVLLSRVLPAQMGHMLLQEMSCDATGHKGHHHCNR